MIKSSRRKQMIHLGCQIFSIWDRPAPNWALLARKTLDCFNQRRMITESNTITNTKANTSTYKNKYKYNNIALLQIRPLLSHKTLDCFK